MRWARRSISSVLPPLDRFGPTASEKAARGPRQETVPKRLTGSNDVGILLNYHQCNISMWGKSPLLTRLNGGESEGAFGLSDLV